MQKSSENNNQSPANKQLSNPFIFCLTGIGTAVLSYAAGIPMPLIIALSLITSGIALYRHRKNALKMAKADLFKAVKSKDVALAETILETTQINIDALYPSEEHPSYQAPLLIHAVDNADLEMVKFLIAHNARVDNTDSNGNTALYASMTGFGDTTIYQNISLALIEAGANVNARFTRHNLTPLMIAAQNNDLVCIKALMSKGADPYLFSEKDMPVTCHGSILPCLFDTIDAHGLATVMKYTDAAELIESKEPIVSDFDRKRRTAYEKAKQLIQEEASVPNISSSKKSSHAL